MGYDAVGHFDALSDNLKIQMKKDGYSVNGQPNFPIYTKDEYHEIPGLLKECVGLFVEFIHQICDMAGAICAEIIHRTIFAIRRSMWDLSFINSTVLKIS